MSLYRKYRPQNFSDLVGQTELAQILKTQIESGKFSHAYLFTGPKGTGKTTTARIIAKAINCTASVGGEPDGKCPSCISFDKGSNFDIIEIDAASNRGIEEIRDLREKIKLSPTQGLYKVYIIDEVHMLTTEAFNALLKTLEEPPRHAIFILCTTEAHKVPETVTSRTQRFEFHRADEASLSEVIKKVTKKEGIEVDKDGLQAVINGSDGSFRDALTLLEQVSGSGPVTMEKVNKLTGRGNQASKLFNLLEEENSLEGIRLVNALFQSGTSLTHLTTDLLLLMRSELLRSVEEGNNVRQLKLIRLIKLFTTSFTQLKGTTIPTLPLELAIVEGTGTKERIVAEVVQEVVQEAAMGEIKEGDGQEATVSGEVTSPDLKNLKSHWDQLLRQVKPINHSLEAFLRGCEPYEFSGKIVTLKFFYKFHKDMVDQVKNRELVERELGKAVGREIRVKTILGEKSEAKRMVRTDDVKNITAVTDDDMVQKAVDIFNSGVS